MPHSPRVGGMSRRFGGGTESSCSWAASGWVAPGMTGPRPTWTSGAVRWSWVADREAGSRGSLLTSSCTPPRSTSPTSRAWRHGRPGMPDHTAPPVIAQWLATALGGDAPQDARRLGWGFSNETWDVTTVHARRLAVTRFAHPARAAPTARLMAAVAPRLAAVGVPVPQLVSVDGAGSGILTTTFIEGATGASLLGAAGGPVLVGRVMGALWRQLRMVDAEGLPLATTPAAPGVLAASAEATLARLAASLAGLDVRRLSDSIRTVPALLKGRPSGFVHGDFVPANVLVREGAVVALLDFEAARLGDPLFDAAWFRWIVGYHHP